MIRYIIVINILVATTQSVKQYRSDYEYNPKTDAFYKLHTEFASHEVAQNACKTENAKLMLPHERDIVQAHAMFKRFPDIGNHAWVGDDGEKHEIEEYREPINLDSFEDQSNERFNLNDCEVVTRSGEVQKLLCLANAPFICKVEANEAPYDPQCKVYSRGYQYVESVGSCYMISSAAYSWNQAYDECQTQGAHLVVLNSELEHQVVHNLTHYAPKVAENAHSPWYWHAGVRANKVVEGSPIVYKTIFGQTLQEAGYDQWSVGEPNNLLGTELCGSIFTNDGKYNDLTCSLLFAFICEVEVSNKTN
ncbi:uncharacterized protein [Epargyreus clarus]|uniref:uncharacterized protein n=1 Tax=Epargyreus clarus TaxID=520877 RepID=UPI003C2DB43C